MILSLGGGPLHGTALSNGTRTVCIRFPVPKAEPGACCVRCSRAFRDRVNGQGGAIRPQRVSCDRASLLIAYGGVGSFFL